MCTARLGRKPASGLTLVEMIIFIVIISIAVTGVLLVMNTTSARSGDPQLRKQAIAIAEGLLEEIEMARYTYCQSSDPKVRIATGVSGCSSGLIEGFGSENTGTQSRPYDNVIDYVSSPTSSTVFSPVTDINGNTANFAGSYTATVTVSKATLPNMPPDSGANTNVGSAVLITVVVSYGPGNAQTVKLEGYRTQYAPNLPP